MDNYHGIPKLAEIHARYIAALDENERAFLRYEHVKTISFGMEPKTFDDAFWYYVYSQVEDELDEAQRKLDVIIQEYMRLFMELKA